MSFSVNMGIRECSLDEAIILLLGGLAGKFGKEYCFPSQEKMLSLLKDFFGIEICRRTLNYHLKRLETGKYIRRKRRISKGKDGKLVFKSTLYFLGKKAKKWVRKIGRFAGVVFRWFPVRRDERSTGEPLPREELVKRIRELRESLGGVRRKFIR